MPIAILPDEYCTVVVSSLPHTRWRCEVRCIGYGCRYCAIRLYSLYSYLTLYTYKAKVTMISFKAVPRSKMQLQLARAPAASSSCITVRLYKYMTKPENMGIDGVKSR